MSHKIKSKSKKKDLPEPTNLGSFIFMAIITVFKQFIFPPTHIKIGLHFIGLIILSLLKDFQLSPDSYFAKKNNFFNAYILKLAWGWTLILTIPFIFMTSWIYTNRDLLKIRNHFMRVGIATGTWFIFTSLFEYIDKNTGSCNNRSFSTKSLCKFNKHEWINSVDISGHTFLLMHAILFMKEEVQVFSKWDKLKEKLSSQNDLNKTQYYQKLTLYIKLNFIAIGLLSLFYDVMLMTTFWYYHTFFHKLIAACLAITSWFLSYKCFYENEKFFLSPGLPGKEINNI